jgi:predicted nucleic acid-binding protein
MNFFDTSVFVAAFLEAHPFHAESARCIANIGRENAVCASHTLAEIYVTLTRQQPPQKVPPKIAASIVETLAKRVKPVSLNAQEYVEVIQSAASHGLSGAILYDALLLGCARKSGAKKIYTLNPGHFRLVARDLASRVVQP